MTEGQLTLDTLRSLKFERRCVTSPVIPIYRADDYVGYLRCLSVSDTDNEQTIKLLADWRRANDQFFPSQFVVTEEGTKTWLTTQVLARPDRVLFFIHSPSSQPIGHVGLSNVLPQARTAELDNVIRGARAMPGVMTDAVGALLEFCRDTLSIDRFTLRVVSDNRPAIRLYERCGFSEFNRVPLKRVAADERTEWIEDPSLTRPTRFNSYWGLGYEQAG
jgi:perosamine synthetase